MVRGLNLKVDSGTQKSPIADEHFNKFKKYEFDSWNVENTTITESLEFVERFSLSGIFLAIAQIFGIASTEEQIFKNVYKKIEEITDNSIDEAIRLNIDKNMSLLFRSIGRNEKCSELYGKLESLLKQKTIAPKSIFGTSHWCKQSKTSPNPMQNTSKQPQPAEIPQPLTIPTKPVQSSPSPSAPMSNIQTSNINPRTTGEWVQRGLTRVFVSNKAS